MTASPNDRLTAFALELGYQRQSFKGAFAAVYGHALGGQKKRLKDDLQAILSSPEPIARPASPAAEGVRDQGCRVPPPGWWCSRPRGHEGPCAARPTDKPVGAGWSEPPSQEANHPERLSAEELKLTGAALSEWAWEHLAKGYGVSLTVREVSRLIAGVKDAALSAPGPSVTEEQVARIVRDAMAQVSDASPDQRRGRIAQKAAHEILALLQGRKG